jgi:predicted nucleotidyltransferase
MRAAALRTYRELLQAAWVREVPVGAVDETLERVDRILREAGIRFAVAGGFAVIEHGYERFTKDVDLLVLASDLFRAMDTLRSAGFTGHRTPMGARMRDEGNGVQVDLLGTAFEGDERAIERAGHSRLTVIPVEHLVLMKIEAGRGKDEADVIELLKAGASAAKISRYLRTTWPELLPRFRKLAARARAERIPTPRGPQKKR